MKDVRYTEDALKDMRKLGHVAAGKIEDKILAYAANPSAYANQVKKLRGIEALRLRAGDYRILFTEDGVVLRILRIGHRREIYR